MLSAAQVAGIVSQPVMGYLSDRIGRKPVMATGTGLVMLSAFALRFARPGVELFIVRHGEGRPVVLAAPYIHCGGPGRLAGRHPIDGRLADFMAAASWAPYRPTWPASSPTSTASGARSYTEAPSWSCQR